MRNIWLVIKREYLERVRKRSFLLSTILLPALLGLMIVVPGKLATVKMGGERHIVVVAPDQSVGEAIQHELMNPVKRSEEHQAAMAKYKVDIDLNATEAERSALRSKVASGELDGYLWITPEGITARKFTYSAREANDFMERAMLAAQVREGLLRHQLASQGLSEPEIQKLFQDVELDVVAIQAGGESKVKGGLMAFMSSIVLVTMLYMTIFLYAIAVMRAVLEEKNSRVMEVLLSSLTTKELMIGKILGVGAVGLTQILVWVAAALLLVIPGAASVKLPADVHISVTAVATFGVFYLLGYLLYSTMFATLGAVCNSEQEAQQYQMVIISPMIAAIMLMMFVMRQPNSAMSFWMSLVPFLSPILMYMRIVVQMPPLWQIAVSLVLLVATTYGLMVLCARIYRVGVLMYGKRPTVPEIMKWMRYA